MEDYHKGKRVAIDADNNNNDNAENADFLLDDDDEKEIQKIKDSIYKTFDDKKFEAYWIKVKKYSKKRVYKEIIFKSPCGRCMDCTIPSAFKTSLVNKDYGTISKYVADKHFKRLHNHVYIWGLYVNLIFLLFLLNFYLNFT